MSSTDLRCFLFELLTSQTKSNYLLLSKNCLQIDVCFLSKSGGKNSASHSLLPKNSSLIFALLFLAHRRVRRLFNSINNDIQLCGTTTLNQSITEIYLHKINFKIIESLYFEIGVAAMNKQTNKPKRVIKM